jgi:hypothetical protein
MHERPVLSIKTKKHSSPSPLTTESDQQQKSNQPRNQRLGQPPSASQPTNQRFTHTQPCVWAGVWASIPQSTTQTASTFSAVAALRWVAANCLSRRIAVVNMSCERPGF